MRVSVFTGRYTTVTIEIGPSGKDFESEYVTYKVKVQMCDFGL